MKPLSHLSVRSIVIQRNIAVPFLRFAAFFTLTLPFAGCSSTSVPRIESAAKVVYQDATSAAGQKLLADVTSIALRVGLDIAAGDDVSAAIAGVQGAASAVRDYEGLPTAPSSKTIANAAAAGSGVVHVAAALVPNVETLVASAQKTAAQQKINVSTDDIIEALARGFDAVADAKFTPAS